MGGPNHRNVILFLWFQASHLEKKPFTHLTKSLIGFNWTNLTFFFSFLVLYRIFVIWAISSWFRRGSSTPDPSTPAGAPHLPSRNLFPKESLMVHQPFHTVLHKRLTPGHVTVLTSWLTFDLCLPLSGSSLGELCAQLVSVDEIDPG